MRITEEEYKALIEKREPKADKKPKYRNRQKVVGDIIFQSTKEANRYIDLVNWQHSGQITELEHQRAFPIEINGHLICEYVSDFTYKKGGKLIVEDTKSKVTRKLPVYRLKKKLMAAVNSILIQEV